MNSKKKILCNIICILIMLVLVIIVNNIISQALDITGIIVNLYSLYLNIKDKEAN